MLTLLPDRHVQFCVRCQLVQPVGCLERLQVNLCKQTCQRGYSVFCFVRSIVIRGLDVVNSMFPCLVTSLNIFPGLGSSSSDETMRSVLCLFVEELLSVSSAREDTAEFELSRLNASATGGGGADIAPGQSLESSWPPIISLRTKEPSIASRAKNRGAARGGGGGGRGRNQRGNPWILYVGGKRRNELPLLFAFALPLPLSISSYIVGGLKE